jgi:hypothetical protein
MRVACSLPGIAPKDDEHPAVGLLYREDWRQTPAETPITQTHVANQNLTLALYGPGAKEIKKSHHTQPADDPYYVWSGQTKGSWLVILRDQKDPLDLRGDAKVRWRSQQSGSRRLHLVLKLADGTWVVSEQSDGESQSWHEQEFLIASQRWRKPDMTNVIDTGSVPAPDLSRVEEIGFTDLMMGGGSAACSRLDWIEVYDRLSR